VPAHDGLSSASARAVSPVSLDMGEDLATGWVSPDRRPTAAGAKPKRWWQQPPQAPTGPSAPFFQQPIAMVPTVKHSASGSGARDSMARRDVRESAGAGATAASVDGRNLRTPQRSSSRRSSMPRRHRREAAVLNIQRLWRGYCGRNLARRLAVMRELARARAVDQGPTLAGRGADTSGPFLGVTVLSSATGGRASGGVVSGGRSHGLGDTHGASSARAAPRFSYEYDPAERLSSRNREPEWQVGPGESYPYLHSHSRRSTGNLDLATTEHKGSDKGGSRWVWAGVSGVCVLPCSG
jgi:hypothetical protein